ncbi:MAG: HupE/UreJ family protein [Cyclobacteriaceae bacterium]
MTEFQVFYELGLHHILDKYGYDHIIFVIALCAIYQAEDWKKVLALVTAFTFGHSITLALSVFSIAQLDPELVEFLIPMTVFLTTISNLFTKTEYQRVSIRSYVLATGFGLIHGLGYANYLKSLLGQDQSILTQLFAFNLGLEVGQIIIVACVLVAGALFVGLFGVSRRDWKLVISSAIMGISIVLLLESNYLA